MADVNSGTSNHSFVRGRRGGIPPMRKEPTFQTTKSHVVENARHSSERKSLEELCAAYWYPVYFYMQSLGCPKGMASDLTQAFFSGLLQPNKEGDPGATQFVHYDPEHCRFRDWLRMRARWHFGKSLKRERRGFDGNLQPYEPLDTAMAEMPWHREDQTVWSPDRVFDHYWARTVVGRARKRLEAHFEGTPKLAKVQEFLESAAGETPSGGPPKSDRERSAKGRLRKGVSPLLSQCIHAEIGPTVPSAKHIESELELLLHALAE